MIFHRTGTAVAEIPWTAGNILRSESTLNRNIERSIAVFFIIVAVDKKITGQHITGGIKVNAAVDTGHPPLILILDKRGVRPADDFAYQQIFSGEQPGGDVKF